MAVRAPLYLDSGNLKEMSTAEVDEIIAETIYQYATGTIGVALGVVASGGNLDQMTDSRLISGTASVDVSAFPNEATTAEPTTTNITYDKINQIITSGSGTPDDGKTWPVYKTSSDHIQAMSLQDVKDTFLHPAIDLLTTGSTTSQQAGTYHINTSNSVTGSTLVSATPVFVDTRADAASYTSAGIGTAGTTQDINTTINSYFLHRIDGVAGTFKKPIYIKAIGDIDLQEYTTANFQALLKGGIQYTAAVSIDGYKITYNVNGTGNNRGSAMVDTVLTGGSGVHTTRYVGTDDYRAQEFPNGSATTAATNYLKILKS